MLKSLFILPLFYLQKEIILRSDALMNIIENKDAEILAYKKKGVSLPKRNLIVHSSLSYYKIARALNSLEKTLLRKWTENRCLSIFVAYLLSPKEYDVLVQEPLSFGSESALVRLYILRISLNLENIWKNWRRNSTHVSGSSF